MIGEFGAPQQISTGFASVGLFVILVSPAKKAEPIEMPFGLRTHVGPRKHVLDRSPDPLGRCNFEGRRGVSL